MEEEGIPSKSMTAEMAGVKVKKNKYVEDGIYQYCNFPFSQQHAVMIKGKWGSGKTHIVRKILEERFPSRISGDPNQILYISLFGVKDSSEIGELLYQAMHPILSGKGMRIASAIMKGLLKTTVKIDISEFAKGDLTLGSQLPDLKVSELLNGANQRIIVFDDMERAALPAPEILSYINPLVEHDDCKVLILANEEEILRPDNEQQRYDEQQRYREWREKVVGLTLEVAPDFRAAYDAFLNQIGDNWSRTFLKAKASSIEEVFLNSGSNNLRIIKQFLWDFERFVSNLGDRHRKNESAIDEILRVLCALTIEVKSGKLKASEISLDGLGARMMQLVKPSD